MPPTSSSTDFHGAVPIELEWIEPDESGAPRKRAETRYLSYNRMASDRFQQEAGLSFQDLGDVPLPDGFPARSELEAAGIETVADVAAMDAEEAQAVPGISADDVEQIDEALQSDDLMSERLAQLLEANDISQWRFAAVMLWSALLWADPDLTVEEAGEVIRGRDLERIMEKTQEAFYNCMGAEEEKGDAGASDEGSPGGGKKKTPRKAEARRREKPAPPRSGAPGGS
jgi:hypothetical protein